MGYHTSAGCRLISLFSCRIEFKARGIPLPLRLIPEGVIWAKFQNMLLFGAASHTSLHQLGPNYTDADFISYPSMCSDLDKSPCVQNDRT